MIGLHRCAVALSLAMLAGCAQRPASLDQAQAALQTARADKNVDTYAAPELDTAQSQLQSANVAWQEGAGADEAAHRADLAMRQVEIARATAEAKRDQAEIATLQGQLANLPARQTNQGIVLTIGDVLFDTGQATLKPGAMTDIIRLADFLKQNPDRRARIEGHSDSTGSIETNLVLSQRRAESIADALVAAGVPRDRIVATGLGPDFPVASNATAAGRQQNRRVQVVIENAPAATGRTTSQTM